MTRHLAVELPAHLPVSFFDCQLTTLLVQVLNLDAVFFLSSDGWLCSSYSCLVCCFLSWLFFVEGLQLIIHCAVHVTASCHLFAEEATISKNLQGIAKTFANENLINSVLFVFFFITGSFCDLAILDNLLGLFFDLRCGCGQQRVPITFLLLANELTRQCHIEDTSQPLLDGAHRHGTCGVNLLSSLLYRRWSFFLQPMGDARQIGIKLIGLAYLK